MMRRSTSSRGFTLVELNFAIIFIAFLLVGIATTTIYVGKLYQKGLALKTINQTGRQVVDQMRRDITAASAPEIQFTTSSGGQVSRLCLGSVSYVANSAALLNSGGSTIKTAALKPITFVRMVDADSSWCKQSGGVFSESSVQTTDLATELLQSDTIPLALHALSVETLSGGETASGSQAAVVRLTLQIGTNQVDTVNGGICRPPTDPDANFDFCAVREFDTIMLTRGGAS